MEAGPELDRLVAERVMGWGKYAPLGAAPVWYPPGPPAMNVYGHEVPRYSTSISAAWEVVGKLQGDGWALILDNMKHFLGNWEAHFEKNSRVHVAEADTAPLAIALAALKAVGAV